MNKKNFYKIIAFVLILTFVTPMVPKHVHAVVTKSFVTVVADTSPTGIMNNITHSMQKLKDFVLNKLAYLIAKQILHQITMSVVNWINSGFQGSPAFLQNPGAFLLDAADQVTGAFLATDGPLSSLCSPFVIDIRLSLALNQVSIPNKRYECTLSKIIETQGNTIKNGPDIIVNGQVVNSSKNKSINGFTGGDFSQGGWKGFIALTTEPQNNPFGAVLSAQSQLQAKLLDKQNRIGFDLKLGSGFMSWEKCKDVPGGSNIDLNTESGIEKSSSFQNVPGNKQVSNSDGTVSYQKCETQTPGSVISGTLQKNLNVPVEELELAENINAVVNALMSQLINKMLTAGLGALSGNSGGSQSYTQQVINDASTNNAAQATVEELQAELPSGISRLRTIKLTYDQAVKLVTETKTQYESAVVACSKNSSALYSVEQIQVTLNTVIEPLLVKTLTKQASSTEDLTKLEDISYKLSGTGSAEQIQKQAQRYSEFLRTGGLSSLKETEAEEYLDSVESQTKQLNQEAERMIQMCSQIR